MSLDDLYTIEKRCQLFEQVFLCGLPQGPVLGPLLLLTAFSLSNFLWGTL